MSKPVELPPEPGSIAEPKHGVAGPAEPRPDDDGPDAADDAADDYTDEDA